MISPLRSIRSQHPPRLRPALIGLLACVALSSGCGDRDPSGTEAPLAPEKFVEVIVTLREAEREMEADDSLAFEQRKEEILETHGTTEDELRGFVVQHAEDVGVLQAVWDSISQRLKHVPEDSIPDSLGPGSPEAGKADPPAADTGIATFPPPRMRPMLDDTTPRR